MDSIEEQRVFSNDELECPRLQRVPPMNLENDDNETYIDSCMQYATATIDHSRMLPSQVFLNDPKIMTTPELPILSRESSASNAQGHFVTMFCSYSITALAVPVEGRGLFL